MTTLEKAEQIIDEHKSKTVLPLRGLGLTKDHLIALSPKIAGMQYLEDLDLRFNEIERLPNEFLNALSGVKYLALDGNKLTELPPKIGELKSLVELNINGNNLGYIPEEIGDLYGLQVLRMERNQLRALPEGIGKLGSLKELVLHKNQLASVPSTMGGLENLRLLGLNDNLLSSIPGEVRQLPNLQVVSLDRNKPSSSSHLGLGALARPADDPYFFSAPRNRTPDYGKSSRRRGRGTGGAK